MKKVLVGMFLGLGLTPCSAVEIKLDDAMLQKLGQLCSAANYGSRMLAEPICQELSLLVQKAQQEEKMKAAVEKKDEK